MTATIQALEFSYVICAIESRIWTGVITDSNSTVEFTASKEAESDTGKFMKTLVKSSALNRVRNSVNKARAALYAASVPWLASSHLVKIDRMDGLSKVIGEHVSEFNSEVERFLSEYPKLVEGAEKRLGKLFDKSDYPSTEALRRRFALAVVWLPVSQANSSQMAILDKEIAKEVERSVKTATERALVGAQEEAISRALKAVGGTAEALKRYSEKEKAGDRAVLHESRITDLAQAAKDLRDYSFPADQKTAEAIESIAVGISNVALEGADTFKENAAARNASVDTLAEIRARLASMQAF